MTFSDEDLRLFREEVMINDHDKMVWRNSVLRALVLRLEAAEKVCFEISIRSEGWSKLYFEDSLNEWRKACGRE